VVREEAAGGCAALAISRVVSGAGEARLTREEAEDGHERGCERAGEATRLGPAPPPPRRAAISSPTIAAFCAAYDSITTTASALRRRYAELDRRTIHWVDGSSHHPFHLRTALRGEGRRGGRGSGWRVQDLSYEERGGEARGAFEMRVSSWPLEVRTEGGVG
jgi:hypothetical protein